MCAQGQHGSLAVRTEGSGALRGVRIINLFRGTLFWFKVDSAVSATIPVKQEPSLSSMQGQPVMVKQEVIAALQSFCFSADITFLEVLDMAAVLRG